jgi:hypothetical protein
MSHNTCHTTHVTQHMSHNTCHTTHNTRRTTHVWNLSSTGSSFQGDFVKDAMRGFGRMEYPDGRVYQGELQDQEFHGQGELVKPNGDRYVGEFRRGQKHGSGIVYYGNTNGANSFSGQWQQGNRVGKGVYQLANCPQNIPTDGQTGAESKPMRLPVFAG